VSDTCTWYFEREDEISAPVTATALTVSPDGTAVDVSYKLTFGMDN